MRTLALLLLLLNMVFGFWQLGLFAWLPWQPESFRHQRPLPSSASNLPRLILLGEPNWPNNTSISTEEHKATRAEQETTPAADSLAVPHLTADNTSVTENHEIPDQSAEVTSTLQQAAGIAFNSGTDNTSITASPSAAPATPSPLAEAPKDKPKELAEQSEVCWEAGPYNSANQVKTMADWLSKRKNVSVVRQPRETQVLKSTWVYLPFENRQSASNAIKEFEKIGIRKGYNIVSSGEFNNAISLGVYNNPSYAELRVTELYEKGYKNIKTKKRYKNNTKYWLNVKIITGQHEVLNAFRNKFSDSTITTVACE